jgi:twitching motility protein PilU
VGTDTYSYGMALRNSLRQRADVIAIGEIRDRESLEHAIRFAETGHLCVATIHSNNSYQAITRMANLFPDEARKYILATISQNLLSIFSQRLVPDLSGGYTAVPEILLNDGLIRNLIAENRLNEIKEAMERGKDAGLQTFDNALYKFYEMGKISAESALSEADNPSTLKLKITQSKPHILGMQMEILDKNTF